MSHNHAKLRKETSSNVETNKGAPTNHQYTAVPIAKHVVHCHCKAGVRLTPSKIQYFDRQQHIIAVLLILRPLQKHNSFWSAVL